MDDIINLLKSHIITYVSPLEISESQSNSLKFILDKITSKDLNIKGLIELLGNELTNENDLRRARGMSLLSAAIRTCINHSIPFDRSTENAIIIFLIQRLDDYHTQKECIESLYAIVSSREKLEAIDHPEQIFKGIFCSERLHVQSLPQPIRRKVYEILSLLLEVHQSKLLELKEDLVFGFIQAMDGEKDPKNLILCFELFVNIVLNSNECSKFEEDLFEITSCYFPITFTEKPQSNIGVKKIDLVQGLRRTMVASPRFWIPFLLEKLSSSIVETKLEVLSYLNFAFSDTDTCNGKTIWKFEDIEEKIPIIRDNIYNEIFQSTDNIVQTSGLQCIASLTRWVSKSGKDHLSSFVKPLIDKGKSNLNDKYDTKIMSVTSKVLQACTAASDASANIIIPAMFPLLVEKYKSEKDDVQKLCLVRMIVNFAKSTVKINKEDPNEHPLKQFYPQLIEEFIITANTSSIQPQERADAIDLLSTLLTLNRGQLAQKNEVINIIELFISILLYHGPYNSMYNIETYTSVRLASLQALVNMIYYHSNQLISHALPRILKEFELRISEEIQPSRSELSPETKIISPPTVEEIISWIRAFCDPDSIEMTYSISSMVISRHESDFEVQGTEIMNSAIQKHLILLLNKYFNYPKVLSNISLMLSEIIKSESSLLIILNILFAKYHSGIEFMYINKSISDLIYNVVHTLGHKEQEILINRFYNAFINNKLSDIIVIKEGTEDEIIKELIQQDPSIIESLKSLSISPFRNFNDRKFVIVYSSLFIGISIHEYNDDILQNLSTILTESIKILYNSLVYPLERDSDNMDVETSHDTYLSDTDIICKGLESLINKFIKKEPQYSHEVITRYLLDDLHKLFKEIDEGFIKDTIRIESIQKTLVSITKALIRKNIPIRDSFWDLLSARLFQKIESDEDFEQRKVLANMFKGLFCAEKHLPVSSALFKQKYFLKFLPRAVSLFNESNSNSKQQYIILISLTGLLNEIPKPVLVESAETIVPLLLDSIKSDFPELKQETISTLSKLSELSPSIIEPRLSTIINVMLEMSSDTKKANMMTRSEAIKCLLTLHKYPYRLIQPYRELVINGLNKALDDPKRIVRQVAVKCKNKWIMLNQK